MRLTRLTDYSFRVLIFLATNEPRQATIKEIAGAYGISKNHLMKVANLLARHGFVRAVRGRGGGLLLGKAPADISLGDVVRKLEDDFAVVECMAGPGRCRIEPGCELKPLLAQATDAFLKVLDGATLADIVRGREAIAFLLDGDRAARPAMRGRGVPAAT